MRQHIDELATFVRRQMAGFPAPWCVAGGWAIDLFLGRVTRPHADVELAIYRRDQVLLHRQLPGWEFEKIVAGRRFPWASGERLELPVHEIHARSPGEPAAAVEFLLNERSGNDWVFRRNPAITLPVERAVVRSVAGVPVLSPEVVLLFKAKSPRGKDELDFDSAVPVLTADGRQWLRDSLAACHPGHPWIESLVTARADER